MISEKEQKVYDVLKKLNISYTRYEHIPVFTIEEASELDINTKGHHCKNLFIRNRKGNVHYLVVIEESKKVDLKELSSQLKSTPLSFASEDRLHKFLGLTPGSVTPFGLINDVNKEVIVAIDDMYSSHAENTTICFHPNVNTATIEISLRDFKRYLEWCRNKILYVQI
jgi:Ala-tRNA(Pro) deacylase